MKRTFLRAKIHRAQVTRVEIDHVGSLSLDENLMNAAGLLPFERVDVTNVATGKRFSTYVIKAERGSGEVGVLGAAGHKARPGDKIVVAAFALLDEAEFEFFTPRIVLVGEGNRIEEIRT